MITNLKFNPKANQLNGPSGTLSIVPTDELARRFLMLIEGECLGNNVASVAKKYGCCRQRYYQIRHDFLQGGLPALQPKKTGPKSNYRRTDQAVRQVLRYRFLDPEMSPEVIAQKLRQTRFLISIRSVERIIADYGLQKKTLRPEPPENPAPSARQARGKTPAPSAGRPRRPGASGSAASGR